MDKSMKRSNKKRILVFGLLIFLGVIFLYQSYPKAIKLTYDAMEYQLGNVDAVKPVKVTIHGYYYDKLLVQDVFTGEIAVDAKRLKANNIRINSKGQLLSIRTSDGDTKIFGSIYADVDMKALTISVLVNGGWSSGNGKMVSAPAKNRDEALKVSKLRLKDFITNDLK